MKNLFPRLAAVLVSMSLVGALASVAFAASPSLSLYATGNGDSVQVNVTGDPNASVWLYKGAYTGQQPLYLGSTNQAGYISTTVSSATGGFTAGTSVYILVNGQVSQQVVWPSYYGNTGGYGGAISLNQTSVNVAVGQNVQVIISGGSQPYTQYSTYNTNYNFQSVISGNTLTITGLSAGSGSLNICSSGGNGSGCATVSITVNGYNTNPYNPYPGNSQISLSQNSLSLNAGSIGTVTVYGNTANNLYVSSNSNPSVVSAILSGTTLYLNPLISGTSTITVCQNSAQCATVYVTVNGGYQNPYSNNSVITFSQSNLSLSANQSTTVTVSGGSGSGYYVAYNSASGNVQTSLYGNTVTLTAIGTTSAQSAGIVVCSSNNSCGGFTVSLNYAYTTNDTGWTFCSAENGFCQFSGTRNVRYGANGVYSYRTLTNGVSCTNTVFGDPIFRVAKQCSFQ